MYRSNRIRPMAAISTGNLKSMAAQATALGSSGRPGRSRRPDSRLRRFPALPSAGQGSIDLVIESDLNILDIAALVVIVREAGGVFTTLDGGKLVSKPRMRWPEHPPCIVRH